jgi:hypothetical protein
VSSPLSDRSQGSLYRAGIAINDGEVSAHRDVWLRASLLPVLNRPGIQRISSCKLRLRETATFTHRPDIDALRDVVLVARQLHLTAEVSSSLLKTFYQLVAQLSRAISVCSSRLQL